MDLTWTTSASADEDNHDQEVNLDAIGIDMPGGAVWASVSPDGIPGHENLWRWVIYDRWLDVDSEPDPTLADGLADGEELAKAAVAEWVRAHTPAPESAGRVLLRRLRDRLGISGFADADRRD